MTVSVLVAIVSGGAERDLVIEGAPVKPRATGMQRICECGGDEGVGQSSESYSRRVRPLDSVINTSERTSEMVTEEITVCV